MVVCHFTNYTPCVKVRKISPRPRNWRLRDPATSSQFPFKIKCYLLQLQLPPLVVPILQIASSQTKLKGPLLNAATEVCGLSKNHQWKPQNLVVEWTNGRKYPREVCTVQSQQCPEEGRLRIGYNLTFKLNLILKVKVNCPQNNRDLNQCVWHLSSKYLPINMARKSALMQRWTKQDFFGAARCWLLFALCIRTHLPVLTRRISLVCF